MTTPTLSQLADIGAKAAFDCGNSIDPALVTMDAAALGYRGDTKARKAFAKAVLDAVGYKFPVDPEREAFDAWVAGLPGAALEPYREQMFEAWKAGRAARDKELEIQDARSEQEHAAEIADDGPPWIEWKGGECPIPDTVKRWEYKTKSGYQCADPHSPPSCYDWSKRFVAYRVLDWGTAKQPETFEAHGHTWFKHTPGGPMPCDGNRKVNWLLSRETDEDSYLHWSKFAKELVWRDPNFDAIGWRYADS